MVDAMLCYSVGALLYCPANNESIVSSLIYEKLAAPFSLALCLEDTIRDERLNEAEKQLILSLRRIISAHAEKSFYIPKIFIRVRNPEQVARLYSMAEGLSFLISGFITPKFSLENADLYINEILKINSISTQKVYIMPILESQTMIDLRYRYNVLYGLKERLDRISDFVLNIRVGGNDLCHSFGFRRKSNETIYDIAPISGILSDIMTVFGMDYVVSGPVWEYYTGAGWDKGLLNELKRDRLNGFTGKTVIHPNQIPIVNSFNRVPRLDYEDALSILNWSPDTVGLVTGSAVNGRMNEYKTHYNWAEKTIILSQVYGISE